MARATQVADQVVAVLNTATLSQPVTAARYYQPRFELKEMQALHVSVVPKSAHAEQCARNRMTREYEIDIAVQQKFKTGTPDELDPLLGLVEEIATLFEAQPLPGALKAHWIKTQYTSLYAPEHMETLRQFTSVLTLTFRLLE